MSVTTILVLEDEISLAYTLARALEKHLGLPCTVKLCNTGEAALQLIQQFRYDLIITDLRLPGISGLDFVTVLRQTQPEVPIIFMTAFGSRAIESQVSEMADFYLPKPFEIEELIHAAHQLLKRARAPHGPAHPTPPLASGADMHLFSPTLANNLPPVYVNGSKV